jgi:hypothetical protein
MSVEKVAGQSRAQSCAPSGALERGLAAVVLCAILVLGLGYWLGGELAPAVLASVYAACILAAALWPAAGLLLVLAALPFDRTFHVHLNPDYWGWVPARLHLVDALTVVLLLGLVRLVRSGVGRARWRWYDVLYAAWVLVMVMSAVRGVIEGHPGVLRKSRSVLWLMVYFPAREILASVDPQRCLRVLLVLTIVLCLLSAVVAGALRQEIGRRADVLLPRLHRATNIAPLLMLPILGWVGVFADASRRWRRAAALIVLLAGSALAMANSRASLLALACASLAFACLVVQRRRRKALAVLLTSSMLFVLGFLGTHAASLSMPRITAGLAEGEVSEDDDEPLPILNVQSWADSMRLTARQLTKSDSWVNRQAEVWALRGRRVLDALGGKGIGATITYEGLDSQGAPMTITRSYVHSYYFHLLHVSGVLGLTGFLAVLLSLGWRAGARAAAGEVMSPIDLAAVIGLAAMLPAWHFIAQLMDRGAAWPAVVLAGAATYASAEAVRGRETSDAASTQDVPGEAGQTPDAQVV